LNGPGRVVATVRALLIQPGLLTREYLDGHRTQYVGPARLWLGCAIVYFALNWAIAAGERRVHPASHPGAAADCSAIDLKSTAFGDLIAAGGLEDSLVLAEIDTSSLSGRIVKHAARIVCRPERFERLVPPLLSAGLVAWMPVFALLMWLVFRSRAPSFSDSAVFTLHFHAMLFIVLIASDMLSIPDSSVVETLAALAGVVFTSWQYYASARCVYRAGTTETAWKTALVGGVYGAGYMASAVVVLTWILLRM
jgi:hypothetical protein